MSSSTAKIQDLNAGDAEELPQKKKTSNPLIPKRGEIKNRDGFMLIKIEIQMYDISDLPPDTIVCEVTQLTSKFCIILRDPQKNLKSSFVFVFFFVCFVFYKDNQRNLKGDRLCCYLKKGSLDLALKLFDEDKIRSYRQGQTGSLGLVDANWYI